MRTPIFVAALGLSLVGCLVGDSGTQVAGGGDDDGPGSGSNPGSGSDPVTPKLDVTVDKATMATELLSTNMMTVTLVGSGGFAGQVSLVGSVVDAGGLAIPGWIVSLDKPTVDVAADGAATAVATLKIPSDAKVLTGTVNIAATSSLGPTTVSSVVTVAKQMSLTMNLVGTTCGPSPNTTLTIAQGTKVRWVNGDAAKRITIHIQNANGTGGITGFAHEPDPGMAPNGTFEQTANGTGAITWYCHAPGTDNNRYTITATP